MSNYPDPHFTFAGARYRLIVPAANQRAPEPMREQRGVWLPIPYGGNIYIKDGASGITQWSPTGGIVVVGADSYSAMRTLYNSETFATLRTPFGSFNAILRAMDLVYYPGQDEYRGSVRWEWA